MNDSTRTPKGQFKNGTSGNPSGRPAGSRNKTTLACELLLEGEAEELITTLVAKAKSGNIQALGMCLDRLLPARKDRSINLAARDISNLQDLPLQFQDITTAIVEGNITPSEGESLSNILTSHSKIMERVNLDKRIASLEQHLTDVKQYRREMDQFMEDRVFEKILNAIEAKEVPSNDITRK
jgi:hypothetical protein